jgi:hypothetical protein
MNLEDKIKEAGSNEPRLLHGKCYKCGGKAVYLVLISPNGESVSWCENGEVVVMTLNERPKTVHNFREDDYDR